MATAAHTSRNRDIVEFIVKDPGSWDGEAFVFKTETEAYEMWAVDTRRDAYALYPAEGRLTVLNGDFEERMDEDEAEARSLQRHYSSLRVA